MTTLIVHGFFEVRMKEIKAFSSLLCFRYRCVMPFPAASPQELNLVEGDIVFVQRKAKARANEQDATPSGSTSSSSEGWLKGRHATSGAVGYFPAMFVQKF
jgi:hypothetical protein